ncbi:MAG: hypothetical protein KVP17_002727 [Porospora cf. gigantea B]|uniref:uncharacterized protein n=1 Tax=Porospora cf. gigantea B TaxID=2853592 RepID=UPI003571BA67|nr:MAG: hypothetical protein KVP17_002727 [Porospora cf. gigantea B]
MPPAGIPESPVVTIPPAPRGPSEKPVKDHIDGVPVNPSKLKFHEFTIYRQQREIPSTVEAAARISAEQQRPPERELRPEVKFHEFTWREYPATSELTAEIPGHKPSKLNYHEFAFHHQKQGIPTTVEAAARISAEEQRPPERELSKLKFHKFTSHHQKRDIPVNSGDKVSSYSHNQRAGMRYHEFTASPLSALPRKTPKLPSDIPSPHTELRHHAFTSKHGTSRAD